jgi:hypothetical protein
MMIDEEATGSPKQAPAAASPTSSSLPPGVKTTPTPIKAVTKALGGYKANLPGGRGPPRAKLQGQRTRGRHSVTGAMSTRSSTVSHETDGDVADESKLTSCDEDDAGHVNGNGTAAEAGGASESARAGESSFSSVPLDSDARVDGTKLSGGGGGGGGGGGAASQRALTSEAAAAAASPPVVPPRSVSSPSTRPRPAASPSSGACCFPMFRRKQPLPESGTQCCCWLCAELSRGVALTTTLCVVSVGDLERGTPLVDVSLAEPPAQSLPLQLEQSRPGVFSWVSFLQRRRSITSSVLTE